MKKLKKLGASLLALVMVLAMVAPAVASKPENPNIGKVGTSKLTTDGLSGHEYVVYPLFTGEVSADGITLKSGSIQWVEGVQTAQVINALKALNFGTQDNPITPFADITDANSIADVLYNRFTKQDADLKTVDNVNKIAEALANPSFYSTVKRPGTSGEDTANTGYCVAIETVGDKTFNHLMMLTDPEHKFNTKVGKSTVGKFVEDGTDNWSDGTVGKAGEAKSFQLRVKLPDNLHVEGVYTTEKGYNPILHDYMGAGLDPETVTITSVSFYNSDMTAETGTLTAAESQEALDNLTYWKADGCDKTRGTGDNAMKCAFEIQFKNLQENNLAQAGGYLVVEYTAELKEDAVFGAPGNVNDVDLEVDGETVPGNPVKVFRIELTVNKTDANNQPLDGARFTLYPKNEDGSLGEGIELGFETVGYIDADGNEQADLPAGTPEGTLPEGWSMKSGSLFVLEDLEPGTYVLKETLMPDGKAPGESIYSTPVDIEFTVQAKNVVTPKEAEAGELELKVLNVSGGEFDSRNTDTGLIASGIISTTIQNLTGITLPETGGIGTTIFYIAGGALAIGAVVLLITKRRVGSADDE